MRLSVHNPIIWFIKANLAFENDDLKFKGPRNHCQVFWYFVWSIFISPFHLPNFLLLALKPYRRDPARFAGKHGIGHPFLMFVWQFFALMFAVEFENKVDLDPTIGQGLLLVASGAVAVVIVVGVIGLTAGLIITVSQLIREWALERGWSTKSGKSNDKERGLIRMWLRAKKEKFCPMIEYVEYVDQNDEN